MVTQVKTYNVAGTYSWQCPPDVSSITLVEAWGAGGGGADLFIFKNASNVISCRAYQGGI